MPTIAEQLNELVKQKKALANNITAKGVAAEESEKLNTLVPKVLEIQTGGSGEGQDTSDATAQNADVRNGKTFYARGQKLTGNMPTITGTTITPSNQNQSVSGNGYLDGNITVAGDSNLLTQNIKQGISIFGVEGAYNVVDTSTEVAKAATSNDIVSGKEAWVNGGKIVGDSNVMDTTEPANTTASASNVQEGMSAYVNGVRIVGTCVSMDGMEITPTAEDQTIRGPKILQGNKTMTIKGDINLLAENIKAGITIFGVTGTYSPSVLDSTPYDCTSLESIDAVFSEYGAAAMIYVEDDEWRTLNGLKEYNDSLKPNTWSPDSKWVTQGPTHLGINFSYPSDGSVWKLDGKTCDVTFSEPIMMDGTNLYIKLLIEDAAYAQNLNIELKLVQANDWDSFIEKWDAEDYAYEYTYTFQAAAGNEALLKFPAIVPNKYYAVLKGMPLNSQSHPNLHFCSLGYLNY